MSHIKIYQDGHVQFSQDSVTMRTDIENITIDFDDETEEGYEEHDFAEVIATYKAMQASIAILKAK